MHSPFGLLVGRALDVLVVLIIIEVIISNIIAFGGRISPYSPPVQLLRKIVDPLLNPFRRLLPPYKTGGWDLSPIIVILILQLLRSLLY